MTKSRLFSFLFVSLLVFTTTIFAQPNNLPWEISYQGVLTDTTGSAVADGNYNLEVSIFDNLTGGTELYNESHTNVMVKDGFFNINIGDQTADGLYPEIDMDGILYLELRINGGSPITPRFKLRPSPAAITSYNAAANSVDSISITDNSISLNDINPSGAASGEVIMSDGSNLMWGTPTGLSLPASFFIDEGYTYQSFILGAYNAALRIDTSNTDGVRMMYPNGNGLYVESAGTDGINVAGESDGIYAWGDYDNDGSGLAGNFIGDVDILGNLSKGGGSFKIDHPLYPKSKYLYHSFVESPDMMNVYNGNVQLNQNGEAVVELPDYFEALNKDFRYQLTPIGAPGPNLYVAEKISENTFKIAGGEAGMEVSWQVTGIRNDPYAKANRIKVEVDKAPEDVGYYLYPEVYGVDKKEGISVKERVKEMQKNREARKLNQSR